MSATTRTAIRIIDANLNRARETLRVMEEYARFGLEDSALAAAAKEIRHGLADAVPEGLRANLITCRDTDGDVGRRISTKDEYERSDPAHVAQTAGKRLSEALRAIEEYGKTVDSHFAVAVERLRYRGYRLEQRLNLTIQARERFGGVRLYVLLTEALCHGDWLATAQAALQGGADCLQLREKHLTDRTLLKRAKRLVALCRDHGALLMVNDRPDIAASSEADGVHLGQEDVTVADARRILPATAIVGLSTHTIDQVTSGAAAAPDYLAVGPMFATATKPQEQIPGPALLASARAHTALPLVAIGGINPRNAPTVLSAGGGCLCVCRAVIAQPDAAAAAAELRAVMRRGPGSPNREGEATAT